MRFTFLGTRAKLAGALLNMFVGDVITIHIFLGGFFWLVEPGAMLVAGPISGVIVLSGVIISLSTRACPAGLSGGTATELGDGIVTHFCTFNVVSILDVPSFSLDVLSGLTEVSGDYF